MAKKFKLEVEIVQTEVLTGDTIIKSGTVDFNIDGSIVVNFNGVFHSFPDSKSRFNISLEMPK